MTAGPDSPAPGPTGPTSEGPGAPGPRPPGLDRPLSPTEAFEIGRLVQHGFEMLQRSPAPLLVGALLLFFVDMCSGGGGQVNVPSDPESLGELEGLAEVFDEVGTAALMAIGAVVVGCGLLLQIAFWLAKSFLMVGWLRTHERIVVQGDAEVGLLFEGKDRLWPAAWWYLLAGVIRFGVGIVTMSPGAAVVAWALWGVYGDGQSGTLDEAALTLALGGVMMAALSLPVYLYIEPALALADRAVILGGRSPMEALDDTWQLVSGHRVAILLFGLVAGLLNFIGFAACCIGMVPIRAAISPATTTAWMLATRSDRSTWAVKPLRT